MGEDDERVRALEQALALAQELAGIGSFDWSVPDGRIVWTEGLERLYGLEPGEYRGTCEEWFEQVHPEDRDAMEASVRRSLEQCYEWRTEFRILRKEGAVRWIRALGRPLLGPTGGVTRFLGANLDITERKVTEAELHRSTHELRERIKELSALYAVASLTQQSERAIDEVVMGTLQALVAAYQYPEITSCQALLDGETYRTDPFWQTAWRQAAAIRSGGREVGTIEVFYREERPPAQDGPFLAEESVLLRTVAELLGRNLDERRARRALRASEARFREVIELIPDVLYRVTLPGGHHAEFVSPAIAGLLGFSPQEWQADPEAWVRQLHEKDRIRVLAEMETALGKGVTGYTQEYRIWHKDGRTLRWVEDRHRIERDGQGEPLALFGAMSEITERKRDEEQLRRANAELQQFAYVASHDLRAPLRAVSNLASWIEEDLGPGLSGEHRQSLHLLRDRVRVMDSLIEGLLAYSRAGGESRSVELVDSGQLAGEVVKTMEVPDGFTIEIPDDMPLLTTDRTKLQQVFANLLGNAVKFHDRPDGHVWLSARDAGEWCEFLVSDDGPGIPPEYHERVFQMLRRGPSPQAHEGSGIGLAVVKKLVENVGGRIRLESTAGERTTFRFTWPKVLDKR